MGPPSRPTPGSSTDSVRQLQSYLQNHSSGDLTTYLAWNITQSGPDSQKTHHAAVLFGGSVIGKGSGTQINAARREAAMGALQYLRSHGVTPKGGSSRSKTYR